MFKRLIYWAKITIKYYVLIIFVLLPAPFNYLSFSTKIQRINFDWLYYLLYNIHNYKITDYCKLQDYQLIIIKITVSKHFRIYLFNQSSQDLDKTDCNSTVRTSFIQLGLEGHIIVN